MSTINLLTGQISEIVSISPGTRITSSGNGSIQWTPGSLSDAKNNATWTTWAKGSAAGYMDVVRQMCIRATATGAMTVTIEEGRNDKYGEDAYFEEDTPYLSTDSNGNTVLVGADGAFTINNQRIVATLGDSFVYNGNMRKAHISSITIATGVATITLTESSGVTNGTVSDAAALAGVEYVDIEGLPRAFAALNGSKVPLTARNTTNNTVSIATTLGDVAATGIKNGATISFNLVLYNHGYGVFTPLEWLLGNSILIPPAYRRGWGSCGFTITGNGYVPFTAQCRQLLKDAGALVPHEVWVHYGTNDIASDRTLAQIQAEVMVGLGILKQGGVQKVRLSKIWPRLNGTYSGGASAATKAAVAVSVNTWFDTLDGGFVSVLDATSALQDTGLSDFQPYWVTGSGEGVVKADGLHPSHRGAMVFGQAVYPTVAADFPPATRYPIVFSGTDTVAVTDMSGTLPDNWTTGWETHPGAGTAVLSTDASTGELTITLDAPATDQMWIMLPAKNAGTVYEPETYLKPRMTLDVVSAAARFRAPYVTIFDEAGTYDGYVYINTSSATDYLDPVPITNLMMSSGDYWAQPTSTQIKNQYVRLHGAGVGSPVIYRIKDFTL